MKKILLSFTLSLIVAAPALCQLPGTKLWDVNTPQTVISSTNLLDWTELTNFVSETFTNQVVDTTATNAPGRFYRLSTATE